MAKSAKSKKKETAPVAEPADITDFINEDRSRYYGKRIGDRVTHNMSEKLPKIVGTVTKYSLMDNNRVEVLWDGAKKSKDEVAEWLTIVEWVDNLNPNGHGILEQKGITLQGDGSITSEESTHMVQSEEDLKNQPEMILTTNSPIHPGSVTTIPAQQAAPSLPTQELITAQFKVGLTRFRYEAALQGYASMKVTEDNMKDVQEKLKQGRGLVRKMDDLKSQLKQNALRECRMWDVAFRELAEPLTTRLDELSTTLNKVAAEQARKAEEVRKEEQRKADIRTAIDNFILEQSQAIAGAESDDKLVSIQKVLGSAKANKSRYQEFLPDLIERINSLNPLINAQKDAIRQLQELEEQKKKAEASGDDATLIAIEDKKDALNATVEEHKVLVQEKAIDQATKPGAVVTAAQVFNTVKTRRTKWKIELQQDAKSIRKAFDTGLLDVSLNKEKAEILIDTLKDTGQLKDVKELFVNGCRIYLEELF